MIEDAAVALRAGCLDLNLTNHAAEEAHKLAGACASFGYGEASQIARNLELVLRAPPGDQNHLRGVLDQAAALRRALDPTATPACP